jgi:hypothetical protein
MDDSRKTIYFHQDVRYVDRYSITRQPEYEVGILLTHCRVIRKAGATRIPIKTHVDLFHEDILFWRQNKFRDKELWRKLNYRKWDKILVAIGQIPYEEFATCERK